MNNKTNATQGAIHTGIVGHSGRCWTTYHGAGRKVDCGELLFNPRPTFDCYRNFSLVVACCRGARNGFRQGEKDASVRLCSQTDRIIGESA